MLAQRRSPLTEAGVIVEDAPRRRPRRDAASGGSDDRARLLRFVVAPDGAITPDIDGKLPGRGLWVAASRRALDEARRGRFARAARCAVRCPEDLGDRVEHLLARRCVDAIGLARRGGRAVFGFEKTKAQLTGASAKWTPALLLHACDAAEDGRRKLAGAAEMAGAEIVTGLRGDELGQAFARDWVAHAAIGSGALAIRLRDDLARLTGLREHEPHTPVGAA